MFIFAKSPVYVPKKRHLNELGFPAWAGKLWSCLGLYSSVYSLSGASLPKVNWTQMLTTQQLGHLTPRAEPWGDVREGALPCGRYCTHRRVVRSTGRTAAERGPKDGSGNLWLYLEQSFLVWHSILTLPPLLTAKKKSKRACWLKTLWEVIWNYKQRLPFLISAVLREIQ